MVYFLDLAHQYFPDRAPRYARQGLKKKIEDDPELLERLTALGYKPYVRWLTPKQVQLIRDTWGVRKA